MKRREYKSGTMALYLLLLAVVVVVMVMARNCSTPTWHVSDDRAGGDTLNVAIEISPIGISTRGDTLSGYYYDMVRMLAQAHDRPLKIDGFTHLESVLESLESGRYDVVIGDIAANSRLRERFRTTRPVLIDRQVLVQCRDSAGNLRYPDQFSLTGDTIHVPLNSPFKTRLEHLTRELGDTIYIEEDPELGSEQLIIMVAKHQMPNAVVNSHLAEIMKADYPWLDSSVEISFNQFQSWFLNKRDSVLCDTLDSWIGDFQSTPSARRLLKRYHLD